MTLIEHSFWNSLGGFYVSTTLKRGNEAILPSDMFADSKIQSKIGLEKLSRDGIAAEEIGAIVSIKKAFEYELHDLKGVVTDDHGIVSEKEFFVNAVAAPQVKAFREVLLIEYVSQSTARAIGLEPEMSVEQRIEWRKEPGRKLQSDDSQN